MNVGEALADGDLLAVLVELDELQAAAATATATRPRMNGLRPEDINIILALLRCG